MNFDNSYARLPERFFQRINPVPVKGPELIRINTSLARDMDLDLTDSVPDLADIFSGNKLPEGAEPIAQAYAGHQFGNFVPQLGDGRAILLGELVNRRGKRFDLQLKGSGQTRFSRNGDGRSPLGPVIREYVISEAMHNLGIPTTRALAIVSSGETVYRETELPGAILTRVASSHIRVGTFEYFASRNDTKAVTLLADYVIGRHYPHLKEEAQPYVELFKEVCKAQARLVAKWMRIGFIHGVMNTDNTTISGETIDYGPCAFMDSYDPATVFSSIDHYGRYAYGSQPKIMQWNMACLGGCLLPLFNEDKEKARTIGEDIVESFQSYFRERYFIEMCSKIGITDPREEEIKLLNDLLELMHRNKSDFTRTFRELCNTLSGESQNFIAQFVNRNEISVWLDSWHNRLESRRITDKATEVMLSSNPAYIPRNHKVEAAIKSATERKDYSPTVDLLEVIKFPYETQPGNEEYLLPPEPEERVYQTFCGT